MRAVGIHAFRVEQSRHEFRSLLQPQEMELLMLDIFDWESPLEDWWKMQIRYWGMFSEAANFAHNLNSWSF